MGFRKRNKGTVLAVHLILTALWLTNLSATDSYFSVCCLCALSSAFCLCDNLNHGFIPEKKASRSLKIFSVLLALASVLANYRLFEIVRNPVEVSAATNGILNILEAAVTFLAGIPIFASILLWLLRRSFTPAQKAEYSANRSAAVFWGSFCIIAVIDLLYLFISVYPGNLSHDTMHQIGQMTYGTYNNFTPFWHTQIIRVLMAAGYKLFGTPNAAAAFFCVIQSLFLAAVFAYAVMTLYEQRVPKYWLVLSFCLYAFMPYNIAFSGSIWKDVLFGGAVALTVTAMYRILRNTGTHGRTDRIALAAGGILCSMARTNGFYVMALTFLILAVVMRKQIRTMLVPWLMILILGLLMNGPVLTMLGIEHIKSVETMSVPLQQIGRVLTEGGEMEEADRELLNRILPVEEVPELYQNQTADPMKDLIDEWEIPFIREHGGEFLRLWIRTGFKNPGLYAKAWIDLTRGYWNGGYDYYIYAEYIAENDFGFYTAARPGLLRSLIKGYFTLTRETRIFEPLLSIGLMVWLTFAGFWLTVLHRSREALLYVPLIVILVGLWLGAPVYSEFRYAYPLFTVYPLLFPSALHCAERKDP